MMTAEVWKHRAGDQYIAVTRYPQGSLEDWRSEIVWTGDLLTRLSAAKRHGFRVVGSDDFNIGVVRHGRLVGWTWMGEDIGEDPAVIAEIHDELVALGVLS